MKFTLRKYSNASTIEDDENEEKNVFTLKNTFESMIKESISYNDFKKMLRHTKYIPEVSIFEENTEDTYTNTKKKSSYIGKNIFGNKHIDHIVTIQDCDQRGSYLVYFWFNKKNGYYYHSKCYWILQDSLGEYETLTDSSIQAKINGLSYQIKYTGILKYTFSLL